MRKQQEVIMGIPRKDAIALRRKRKEILSDYLSNSETHVCRKEYHKIIGMDSQQSMRQYFSLDELAEIEGMALDKYEARAARHFLEVHRAVKKKATRGDTKAAELYYKRVEGWQPGEKIQIEVESESLKALEEIYGDYSKK